MEEIVKCPICGKDINIYIWFMGMPDAYYSFKCCGLDIRDKNLERLVSNMNILLKKEKAE